LISHQFGHVGLATLAMPIFNVELGVAPAVVGGILMAARLLDAFSDPVMGFISDNTRTRWGRRRPYLALGALLCAILYPLIWMAGDDWSQTAKAWYFGILTLIFFQAHTVFSVPYLSLAFELTNDYTERTRLQAWRAMFNTAALLVIGWFFYFCQLPVWGSAVQGAAVLGWVVGAAILLFGLVPAFFLREVNYAFVQHQKKQSFWKSAREVFRNKPFLILMGIIIALNVGVQTAGSLGFYLNVYYLYDGDKLSAGKLIGISQIVAAIVGFASAPLIAAYARRRDKTVALRDCMLLSLLGAASSWFLFLPSLPYLSLVPLLLLGLGGNAFWILVNSMKADICDWDELSSGERREGLYGALGNWLQKSAISLTYLFAGVLLQMTGFDAALGSEQTEASITGMRLGYAILPVVFLVPCLLMLRRYPINQKVAEDMQATLQTRRLASRPSEQ
jgi:GPH family glycoside/pentoside/hexuronide:cation symporter